MPPLRAEQDGRTAAMAAAQNGHLDVVRLLLDSRAHVHAANTVRASARIRAGTGARAPGRMSRAAEHGPRCPPSAFGRGLAAV